MTLVPSNHDNGYGQVAHYPQPYPVPQMQPAGPIVQQQQQVVQGRQMMRLTEWADEARAAAAIAASLVKTSFVPKSFAGKVEEATAAILTGAEMGLSPMASLRAIYVIHGTPSMYAKTMRAVLQSHGHEIWETEATTTRVTVKGRRKGSDKVESVTWTMDRAKAAGVTTNDQYRKNPINMLRSRATAEVCWLVASDALHGIAASVEELGEDPDGHYASGENETLAEAPTAKRTAKRKPLERMESSEPPLPPSRATVERAESSVDEPVTAQVERPDQRLMAAMFATFNDANIKEKDDQLRFIAEVIGRTIESRTELTTPEVRSIIDVTKSLVPPAGNGS